MWSSILPFFIIFSKHIWRSPSWRLYPRRSLERWSASIRFGDYFQKIRRRSRGPLLEEDLKKLCGDPLPLDPFQSKEYGLGEDLEIFLLKINILKKILRYLHRKFGDSIAKISRYSPRTFDDFLQENMEIFFKKKSPPSRNSSRLRDSILEDL